MEEKLHKLRNWASHGTLRQFRTEISAKLANEQEYEMELEGDTLTCYRVRKEGGFLGIGVKKIKETVLKVIGEGADLQIPEDSADAEFIELLSQKLKQH